MNTEAAKVGDSVSATLGNVTEKPHSKNVWASNVHVVVRDADGNVKHKESGENLVTDYGDDMLATRTILDSTNIVTGMRLGTSTTVAAKAGAGAAIVTYISGSNEALDSAAGEATKGAGAGWRTTYVCTWVAGDVTNSAIAEVVLTNETPLTSVAGAVGNTVARYKFASTIDKQAGDSLEVTWNIDFLGA